MAGKEVNQTETDNVGKELSLINTNHLQEAGRDGGGKQLKDEKRNMHTLT
eukprot:m.112642 g.112642  ORF g.112642 m.112642 type:complete len:50 (-) comp12789_c1_seq7:353-502(-)